MSDKQARINHYAQAIFQIMVERWQSQIEQIGAAVNRDPALVTTLNDPAREPAAKIAALDTALNAALPQALPQEVVNFVHLLVQEGDFALLAQVGAALAQTASGRGGPTKAEIVSAVALSADEQQAIRAKLAQEYGDGLVFNFGVDPALMGGLRVRVGDKLIDNSVASRLARLRESLAAVVR